MQRYLFDHCTYHSIYNTLTYSYDMMQCVTPVLYSIYSTLARTWICQDVVFTCFLLCRNYMSNKRKAVLHFSIGLVVGHIS